MVAVVYPIVVAFVTILIQRQAASKASLEAYFVKSSAKLTGLSSLALVLLMGVQFLFLDVIEPLTGFAWLVADGAWFILNASLSLYFLAATFQFASPDGRIRARNRYVLTRAWPDEWAYHLSRLVALEPVKNKLLDAPLAMDDLASEVPAFSAYPRQVGTHAALQVRFRGAARIVDIRYRILQWAFNRWAKRAGKRVPLTSTGVKASLERRGPVLEMGAFVHTEFSHVQPVFRIGKTGMPSWFEQQLLRASVSLSSMERPRVTVLDALDEARLDSATAIQQDSVADFEKRLGEFIELFDQIIESSHFVRDGKGDNWSLLPSSDDLWGGRTVGQQWEKAFLDLHSVALSAAERRSDFAERTVRVPSRFFLRQSEFSCPELRLRYVTLQYAHLRLLLDWGAERLPAASERTSGRLLNEPLRRRYEGLLKGAVSAWESLKNRRLSLGLRDSAEWEQLQEAAPLFERHLRLSASLVSACLRADDRAGVYWLGDSFLKWRSQLESYRPSEGVAYVDRFKVLYDDLLLSLQQFRVKFPLEEYKREDDDTLRAAWHVALGNLWADVALVLLATTITHPGASLSQMELSASFVRSSLSGAERDGASAGSERVVDGPDRVVSSIIRLHALGATNSEGYNQRIEQIADSLVPSAVSEGIAGRIYSSRGSSLDNLDDGYLFIMTVVASKGWKVSTRFDEAVRGWVEQDAIRQALAQHLARLRDRAESEDVRSRLGMLWRLVTREPQSTFDERLGWVKEALDEFIRRIQEARTVDIQNLDPHEDELARISGYAAEALRPPFAEAPLFLFREVASSAGQFDPVEVRSMRITGWDKGSLTRPRLAEPVSNENEYVRDLVRQTLAIEVVRDVLTLNSTKLQGVATRQEFLEEVERFGREAVANGGRALLLVSSRADPPWLIELARRDQSGGELPIFRRVATPGGHPASYCGNIGDTEVHVAPVPRGESILCTASVFQRLEVSVEVQVVTRPESDPYRCSLEIGWGQRADFDGGETIRLQHAKPAEERR
jgi:hypothetical protein